jgi:VanZ family protein
VPFFLWLAVIFVESSFPASVYPEVHIIGADKIVHIGVYGLLGFLCYLSLIHQQKITLFRAYPMIITVIICSIYGASDEIHQYFVPNRDCEVWDWIADFVGVFIAMLMTRYYLLKRYKIFRIEERK